MRGTLWLSYNSAVDRCWNFHLALEGERVFGWHFKPGGKHRNVGCGARFPTGGVRAPHEQVWVDGVGFRCAHPLEGMDGLSHEQILRAFCERTNMTFLPIYRAPRVGEQLTLDPGQAAS